MSGGCYSYLRGKVVSSSISIIAKGMNLRGGLKVIPQDLAFG